jgi:mRNA interferase MazF
MAYQRGDVLLVPFPFSDLSAAKVRPAVVISSRQYHSTQPDILLAAITSKVSAAPGLLDYPLSDWRSAGLRYPSAFKPVVFTLEPGRVIHRVGKLTTADLAEIDGRLRLALDLR